MVGHGREVGQEKPPQERPTTGGFLRTPWPNSEAPQCAVQCFPGDENAHMYSSCYLLGI
jgi:hypothetical protein